ncbi:aldose 1-epimerase [Chitinivibrio alkaliphilus]|uniref:Aldose 1-epimerase family protein n=1 Tax=Chitinivibrio alkaliphilus ACht1 TaxID=1313304 RepID=U7D5B9_9BACT|nr:aldose 1-epimerase [Chitinivibrio alkaliphilus]ERP30761.1 aldose 1-epimerase family protein [Chitinivibrio alkaliphilus ACht1]
MSIIGAGVQTYEYTRKNVRFHVDSLGGKILQVEVDNIPLLHYDPQDIKHSGIPLCLPFFGPLSTGKLPLDGKEYPLGQHGFFRDCEFTITEEKQCLLCTLNASEETLRMYPYDFTFIAHYEPIPHGIKMTFYLTNRDTKVMEIAPGVHPYLRVEDPEAVYITTDADHGNNSKKAFNTVSLADCDDIDVVEHRPTHRTIRIAKTPDLHLIGHGLEHTTITPGTDAYTLQLSADMKKFNRMTIWRDTIDAPYICVEPAFEEDALLTHEAIKLHPKETFTTTVILKKNQS